ncbi:MAG: hypothetical protein ISS28_00075 [Candidatus Cloacimonetes bacterium]|nr:hypothetical protein [Candidatus Cloacimonadota bacterium]MBL7085483.1 hypothetical protein [Candidatus Cloacimonadota bacterium]
MNINRDIIKTEPYSESGKEIFPVVHIYYEISPPSISNPQFNLSNTTDIIDDTAYFVSPQVDRFSKAWQKLAKR